MSLRLVRNNTNEDDPMSTPTPAPAPTTKVEPSLEERMRDEYLRKKKRETELRVERNNSTARGYRLTPGTGKKH